MSRGVSMLPLRRAVAPIRTQCRARIVPTTVPCISAVPTSTRSDSTSINRVPFQQTALPDDGAKVAGIAHSQPQRLVLLRTLPPILDDGEADAWGGAVARPTEQSEGLRLLHERSRFDDQCADAGIAGL